jgi:hypothetical protein
MSKLPTKNGKLPLNVAKILMNLLLYRKESQKVNKNGEFSPFLLKKSRKEVRNRWKKNFYTLVIIPTQTETAF